MRDLTIGALSKRTGVKVPTIRYYEQIGLMPSVPRTLSGRRSYGGDDLNRLGFIRHARNLGFEIEEIRQLIALSGDPAQPCADAEAIARRHLGGIDDQIGRASCRERV